VDVTRILEADHREALTLFNKIDKADGPDRQPLIDELATALRAHMELEEAVVYPAMRSVTGAEAVTEGTTEHELARKMLADMLELAPDEPGFGAALDATRAGIEHHVNDEEDEVFPELRRNGSAVLSSMATPFMKKRIELGLPITATALEAASSKDELLAEATHAGIERAASLTKAELAKALAATMA
jgi:iron-sulfur cluster repair protein YtfE (RIC family)